MTKQSIRQVIKLKGLIALWWQAHIETDGEAFSGKKSKSSLTLLELIPDADRVAMFSEVKAAVDSAFAAAVDYRLGLAPFTATWATAVSVVGSQLCLLGLTICESDFASYESDLVLNVKEDEGV
jgi:hypothetical protein